MKILIIGSTGMLGNEIAKILSNNSKHIIFATYKNLIKKNYLKKYIKGKKINFIKYDILKNSDSFLKNLLSDKNIIINCSGITEQNNNNKNYVKDSIIVNTLFPLKLKKFMKNKQKIYQIATNGVFNSEKGGYKEKDTQNLNSVYSATKSLGEINGKNFYNIRCSIIGEELKSNNFLISWFLSRKKNTSIRGFENHIWNGVTTKVFAQILNTIIDSKIKLPNKLHLIPKDKLSKYKLLMLVNKYKKRKLKITKYKTKDAIDRTLNTNYKNINQSLWKKTFLKQLTIEEMLSKFFNEETK